MGSLNLVCPMCCGETFNNPQSLKYHLLSITDNLYCPGCSQRSDSVMALIQHLDKCQQGLQRKIKSEVLMDKGRKVSKESSENKTNILADVKIQQINRSFLATVNDTGIVIVGDPQTIQVDENGEIKVVEKLELDETQPEQNSLDFKISESLRGIAGEKQRRPQSSQGLVAIPISSCVAERKEAPLDKNVIAVLSENSELLDGDVTTFIDVDRLNNIGELDETGLLHVKQELCEMDSDAVYSCTSCDVSFNSVLEHIKQFHDGQEVLLEMAEQLDNLTTTVPVSSMSTVPENSENMVNTRQRQTMNTLRTEECIDSEGRLYTRKVVQIERFWDRTPIQVATSQSAKAPMIEKFFSNVEGIKVREKRLASTPLRMYKCNQCSQQFSKLGNFRVHACLHGNNRCDHCDQSFATPKALQLHTKVHENLADSSQKTFICTTCGTEFCSHKSLRLHSRMHAPVRARHVDAPEGTPTATFTCPECGKIFSESYKDAHMALHTGDSVTCAVCNRKFDSSDSLAMHAAVHTELAPPQSPTPSVSIPTSIAGETVSVTTTALATTTAVTTITTTTAAAVMATATTTAMVTVEANESQKPYQCQHCGRRFTRPHEKVKHERIHTGEKPHACEWNNVDPHKHHFPSEIWGTRPIWEMMLKIISVLPIVIIGTLANASLIHVIARAKALQTTTNLLIVNMSIADLATCLICPWMFLCTDLYQKYIMGSIGCQLDGMLVHALTLVAVFNLSAISYDRVSAIVFNCSGKLTKRATNFLLYTTWFCGIAVAAPLSYFRKYYERQWKDYLETYCTEDTALVYPYWHIFAGLSVWAPLTIMAMCYSAILIKLNRYETQALKNKHSIVVRYKGRIAQILALIVLAFIVCRVPFTALIIKRAQLLQEPVKSGRADSIYILWYVSRYLVLVNAAINPLLYGCSSTSLREELAIYPAVSWLICRRKRKVVQMCSVLQCKPQQCCSNLRPRSPCMNDKVVPNISSGVTTNKSN